MIATAHIVPVRQQPDSSQRGLSAGYYVGRRRNWPPHFSWEIVLVAPARPNTKVGRTSNLLWVYQFGGRGERRSRTQEWLYRDRISGMKEISREWREYVEGIVLRGEPVMPLPFARGGL